MSKRIRLVALGTVAAGAVAMAFLLWSVLHDGGSGALNGSNLSVSEVISRIKQATSREGQVLHSRVVPVGGTQGSLVSEYWIDGAQGVLRLTHTPGGLSTAESQAQATTSIVSKQYSYESEGPGHASRTNARTCPGVVDDAWLAVFLGGCAGLGDSKDRAATVESGSYNGTLALILVLAVAQTVSPSATPTGTPIEFTLTYKTYVAADTFLPLAETFAGGVNGQDVLVTTLVYSNEFISANATVLASLDPKSIGYGTLDVDKLPSIAAQLPLYWLGDQYEGAAPGTSLVLQEVRAPASDGATADLFYQSVGGGVDVILWLPSAWSAYLKTAAAQVINNPTCVTQTEKQIGGRSFTLYLMPPFKYPLPARRSSALADCWWRVEDEGGAIGPSGLMLSWQGDGVVVQITASETGFFRFPENLFSALNALQPFSTASPTPH